MAYTVYATEFIPSGWLTVEQAVAESGYYPGYIRRLANNGTIEAQKVGRVWYVNAASLRRYVEAATGRDRRSGPGRGW